MTVKINTRPWQIIRNLVDRLGVRSVQVGVFDGRNAKIAAVHEFGAPSAGIPERSFMRAALAERADDLQRFQEKIAARVLKGKMSEDAALTAIGVWVRDAMKNHIVKNKGFAPLSPAYAKRKRRRSGGRKNKILIDTGQLLASIVFRIVGRRR